MIRSDLADMWLFSILLELPDHGQATATVTQALFMIPAILDSRSTNQPQSSILPDRPK